MKRWGDPETRRYPKRQVTWRWKNIKENRLISVEPINPKGSLSRRETNSRGGRMFVAASAYCPPYTCQHLRRGFQTRLLKEFQHFSPSQSLGEDISHLILGREPFENHFLEEKKFIDAMKFLVNVLVLLASPAVRTNVDGGFVIGEDQRRREVKEFVEKRVNKESVF
jgi:hypothetical protein